MKRFNTSALRWNDDEKNTAHKAFILWINKYLHGILRWRCINFANKNPNGFVLQVLELQENEQEKERRYDGEFMLTLKFKF